MKYALNINQESNRILSACVMLPDGEYSQMQQVDELPTGETGKEKNLVNWLYVNGNYVYDPIPEPEPPEPTGETITADEMAAAIMEGVNGV